MKDGDKYGYMLLVNGIVKGTLDNSPLNIEIPSIAVTQTFTFKETPSGCNLDISMLDENGQCVPKKRVCTYPLVLDEATNECKLDPNIGGGEEVGCAEGFAPPQGQTTVTDPSECVLIPNECTVEPIPTCQDGETHDTTGQFDECGFDILVCKPVGEVGGGDDGMGNPNIVEPNPSGGCPPMYEINSSGKCQLIGSGTTCEGEECDTGGARDEENFCAPDKFFESPARCFAQLFGGQQLQAGGEEGETFYILFTIAVLVIIIVIIVAIIIRIRRGSGYGGL